MGERDDYADTPGLPSWRPPRWAIDIVTILVVIGVIFQAGLFLNWLGHR